MDVGWKYIWDRQTDLPEEVSLLVPTPVVLEQMWATVRGKELLFPDECNSYEDFERAMQNSVLLTSGPALLRIRSIIPLTRCEIHGYVIGAALTPYRKIFVRCLQWVFRTFKVKRVECFIPSRARSLGRFLRECGFKKEGHLRNRRLYGGKVCSEDVYGLLQEDLNVSR